MSQAAQPKPPKEIVAIADYLLDNSKSGLRARQGKLDGQRVLYFKGKSGINAIRKEAFGTIGQTLPETREEAAKVLESLIKHNLIIKCTKDETTFAMSFNPDRTFTEEGYYVWIYSGSQVKNYLMGFLVLAGIFTAVLFPLWPAFMRDGAWYLSMAGLGFLGFLLVITIIRLIFYVITKVVASPGIWIFPNLYEDVGFFESFVPLYGWDLPPPPKQIKQKTKKSKRGATSADLPLDSEPLLEEYSGPAHTAEHVEDVEEIVADKH